MSGKSYLILPYSGDLVKHISRSMFQITQNIMDLTGIKQRETALIIALILVFALFGLWLRLLPMESLTSGTVPKVIFMDPWYSLRQIEVIASNLPAYPWFDPMNGYPTGKDIDWGPLYPVLTAAIAVLAGATSRAGIITAASWMPPLFSLIMIPFLYTAGKMIADKKTGIIAACLISVIAGEYLYRSFYGYLDHHLFEVIFSTAFILSYLIILRLSGKEEKPEPWKNRELILCSIFAGVVYYLGIMNIPTIVLFSGIIGIFCIIHAIITRDLCSLKALTIAHTAIFGTFILLFALTGIHEQGFGLNQYTPAHIVLALCLIIEPVFLLGVIHLTSDKPRWQMGVMAVGIPILGFAIASAIVPALTQRITEGLTYFFLFPYQLTFINEMQMWDLTRAYHSFNIALLIMVAGLILSAYRVYNKYDPIKCCALIWALIILFSTIMHLRYEYYVAVIVTLYASVALSGCYDILQKRYSSSSRGINGEKKGKIDTKTKGKPQQYIPLVVVGLLVLIITVLSAQITWIVATEQLEMISMNDDWADSLLWLEQNSPDPGVDYLRVYDKAGFTYPNTSYGVLSWWDYGHWITYLAKRIPITTPFQNNVGPVAKFLITSDEKRADDLANKTGARYIILDYEMISSKYSSIPLWATGPDARIKYQKYYYQSSKSNANQYDPVLVLKPEFYKSMVSRLFIFDGSRTNSTGANLIQYSNQSIGNSIIPVISSNTPLSSEQAKSALAQGIAPGSDIVSAQFTHPISDIPALTHYRLVYESPSVTAKDEYAQIHNVKIFERVNGYRIAGTGTIEIPLITNQGRAFTYRQDSRKGEFIVPYSTKRDGPGVKATGPYRIVQTGKTYEVSEQQILTGA